MKKNTIQVYGRLKPLKESEKKLQEAYNIQVSDEVNLCFKEKLTFTHKPSGEMINNKPESHSFRFCKIFDQHIKQEDIFTMVAKPVVDSVLEGYNGTVFAYGQTGSGKTFSIIGGTSKYNDRGMIPRSIEYVFKTINEFNSDAIYTVSISFCEIYNDCGYDLLDPKHSSNNFEDLQRVSVCEDAQGNFHLRNLSHNKVSSKEEALDLLYLGDTHRVTTETPMNSRSSRSHCLFTIHVSARDPQSAVVRHSKLNLVDLSGSERVYKSCINGKTLEEAKHINQSLHFLEQVIVGLSDSDRRHIPYRNSMMTTVLKDSLGGNCLTTMLATLSLHSNNIGETVSTCRFAQRVALIKTTATVNEAIDPQLELEILRDDVMRLRSELSIYKGLGSDESLNVDDSSECDIIVHKILTSNEEETSRVKLPKDFRKIRKCFDIFKRGMLQVIHQQSELQIKADKKINEYREQLKQRDEEIAALKTQIKGSTSGHKKSPWKSSAASREEEFVCQTPLDTASVTTINTDLSASSSNSSDNHEPLTDSYATSNSKLVNSLPFEEQVQFHEYMSHHPSRVDMHNLGEELKLKVDRAKKIETDIVFREGNLTNLRNMEETLINRLEPQYEDIVKPSIQKLETVLGDFMKKQSDLNDNISYLEMRADEKMSELVSEFKESSKFAKLSAIPEERDNHASHVPQHARSPRTRSIPSSEEADGGSPRSLIMDDFMWGSGFGKFYDAAASNRAIPPVEGYAMNNGDGQKPARSLAVQGSAFGAVGNTTRRNSYCGADRNPNMNNCGRWINADIMEDDENVSQSELERNLRDRLKIMTSSEHIMVSDAKKGIFKDVRRSQCNSGLLDNRNDSDSELEVSSSNEELHARCGLDLRDVCTVEHSKTLHENGASHRNQVQYTSSLPSDRSETNYRDAYIGYPVIDGYGSVEGKKPAAIPSTPGRSSVAPDSGRSECVTEVVLTGDEEVDEAIIEFYKGQHGFVIINKQK